MGKTAFVFAGQGAQYPGMGEDLALTEAGSNLFETLDEIRPGTSTLCFSGTPQELSRTVNTQPALFAAEMAAVSLLTEMGVRAQMAAGFSLGELSALAYAGAGSLTEMFRIVLKRGELMQLASEKYPAKMAAVLKLGTQTVEELCNGFESVYPVNYNCPGQITVSAEADQMPAFSAAVKAAGGRVMPLQVGGGFHSPFMQEAADAFAAYLKTYTLVRPDVPVYANAASQPYPEDPAQMLPKQIVSPVRWEESIRAMIEAGADTFVEIGPGQTLSGMIRRIDKTVRVLHAQTAEEITQAAAVLQDLQDR